MESIFFLIVCISASVFGILPSAGEQTHWRMKDPVEQSWVIEVEVILDQPALSWLQRYKQVQMRSAKLGPDQQNHPPNSKIWEK